MKILIISQYFWPESFKINEIAEYLVKKGHEVEVLTGIPNYPHGKYYEGYGVFKKKDEVYEGIKIHRVFIAPRGTGRSDKRLIPNYLTYVVSASCAMLWRLNKKYDTVMVFAVSPITQAYPAMLLKKFKKTPLCMYLCDLWPDTLFSHGIGKSKIKSFLTNRCSAIYKRFDKMLTSSMGFGSRLIDYGCKAEDIEYFPNWAESIYMPVEGYDDVRKKFGIKSDDFVVMFAGNIGFAQSVDTIIAAAEILKEHDDIKFIFVGEGTEKQWCIDFCKEKNITSCYFLERQNVSNMSKVISESDVMLVTLKNKDNYALTLPSRVQSFMACKKPIIACANGETSRVIKEANAGLTCNGEDTKGLAECIKNMYEMPIKMREKFGQNGFDYNNSFFNEEILLSKMENVLFEASKQREM